MQRLFSSFPAGSAGVALLTLRLSLAASLLVSGIAQYKSGSTFLLLSAIGLALTISFGAMLPFCCALAVVFRLVVARFTGSEPLSIVLIEVLRTMALAFLGAGAYSIDARMYGRRVVIIPRNPPPQT